MLALYPPGEERKQLLHTLAQRSLCEAESCPTRLLSVLGGALIAPLVERAAGSGPDESPSLNVHSPHSERAGKVYLVGAGPGDPELLTIKAARVLAAAEALLYDDLVSEQIVALANPAARELNVGKRCGAKSITQDEINRLMIDFARRGLSVVRLKSGDPLVFGRAGEEMEALQAAGLDFEVVPGITAAFGAAAVLQSSLTDRRLASKIIFETGHHAQSPSSGDEASAQNGAENATRVVYMPGRDLREPRGAMA